MIASHCDVSHTHNVIGIQGWVAEPDDGCLSTSRFDEQRERRQNTILTGSGPERLRTRLRDYREVQRNQQLKPVT